ncbi:alpha-hydroxy-acid oxidizing protein [Ramlibacter sp. G-1-2-2]|uniref:Alpha-hydroxy-acid oxidizing protein n=1 Tax=Ramlibacter agri TaxID=2728837 RepID=A0A848H9F5_9BURK|nr:alpha-hydroxy-acid oxidizing protein [Ramlibacter agri]NML46050.1 alpha-hydroxy-acid oxidizing protein [Ramlibacter agri]
MTPLQAIPEGIRCLADYEPHAREKLAPAAWDYFMAAAGDGLSARANRAAWDALQLWPRVLRPLAGLSTEIELLGRRWPTPLLAAPMALQQLAHSDAELALGLAAAVQGAGLVLSMQSSLPMEVVARAVVSESGRGPLWYQLYLLESRQATLERVRRAEAAGFEALVLTVDASVRAPHPAVQAVPADPGPAPASLPDLLARAPTWDDVAWLQGETKLPLLLKGVLNPLDARDAARLGLAGLVVSNHGGRTLDGLPPTAVALPRIADAVGDALPLLVDGGIHRGTDVLKALALGARAVLVGRPLLHALATAGAAGAAHALRLLRDELTIALAQCGLRSPAEAGRELLGHAPAAGIL